jgi:hypothetical protein
MVDYSGFGKGFARDSKSTEMPRYDLSSLREHVVSLARLLPGCSGRKLGLQGPGLLLGKTGDVNSSAV